MAAWKSRLIKVAKRIWPELRRARTVDGGAEVWLAISGRRGFFEGESPHHPDSGLVPEADLEALMWFKHRGWIPAAWILSGINFVAVWVAARGGEVMHAWVHVALTVALAGGARQLIARRRPALANDLQEVLDENERLQEEIDTLQPRVAELEERVDFAERLLARQRDELRRD